MLPACVLAFANAFLGINQLLQANALSTTFHMVKQSYPYRVMRYNAAERPMQRWVPSLRITH